MIDKKITTVKNKTKDKLQIVTGIITIGATLVLNGFLSFVTFGFDFSKIKTTAFWANFVILYFSEMAVMFGMYIIQKTRDLKKDKITDIQKQISTQREIIYKLDRIDNAENWLREVYNYRERLTMYETQIRKIQSQIRLIEPKQTDKHYKRKKAKYDKQNRLRDYCLSQLRLIKKDRERLKIVVENIKTGANANDLQEYDEILNDDEYGFKTAKFKGYKEVYWINLQSDSIEETSRDNSPFFSESKEFSRNVLKYLAMGILWTGILSALTKPMFNALQWETVLSVILNAISLLLFMGRGIKLSNVNILSKYFKALDKRNSIYNQMLKDLGLSKIEFVEEEKESVDK